MTHQNLLLSPFGVKTVNQLLSEVCGILPSKFNSIFPLEIPFTYYQLPITPKIYGNLFNLHS